MLRNVSEETDPPPDDLVSTFSPNVSISSQDRFYWEDLLDTDKLPKGVKK